MMQRYTADDVSQINVHPMMEIKLSCYNQHQGKSCLDTIYWHSGQYKIMSSVS